MSVTEAQKDDVLQQTFGPAILEEMHGVISVRVLVQTSKNINSVRVHLQRRNGYTPSMDSQTDFQRVIQILSLLHKLPVRIIYNRTHAYLGIGS